MSRKMFAMSALCVCVPCYLLPLLELLECFFLAFVSLGEIISDSGKANSDQK